MSTDSRGVQHVRRLSWQREFKLVDTYWRHQLVPLTDSPGSASSFRFQGSSEWHESEPGANGRGHLCVTGIVNAEIRRAGRYGFVAPVSSAYRFARERIVVPLGSSERHESEPAANGRRHLCVSGIVGRVKDAEDPWS
jgi:hypothetical protein